MFHSGSERVTLFHILTRVSCLFQDTEKTTFLLALPSAPGRANPAFSMTSALTSLLNTKRHVEHCSSGGKVSSWEPFQKYMSNENRSGMFLCEVLYCTL